MIDYELSFSFTLVKIAFIKLGITTLLCFLISVEREFFHMHPGGIASHTLIGAGSCLFTMASVYLREQFNSETADPARIAAQIVSGLGFLGSATVYKSKNYLKGINTAANLWISAAIGLSIGADLLEFGIVATFFSIIILSLNNIYKKKWVYKKNKKHDSNNNLTEIKIDNEYDGDDSELSILSD